MSRYFDRSGSPMSMTDWMNDFSNIDKKRVAFTKLSDCQVSTVWLGLDHRFGEGPPMIFETMVFGGPLDQEQCRYTTEEQAMAGHTDILARAALARMVRFATLCEKCRARSPEYTAWPSCRECMEHVCPKCSFDPSEDENNVATCHECARELVAHAEGRA